MQQSHAVCGTRLTQHRTRAARPAGRGCAVNPTAMANRKVNTLDEAWKKVGRCRRPLICCRASACTAI